MMQIDERFDEARLRQFATQITKAGPNVRNGLEQSFLFEQGPEFYHGQAAALAFAYCAATDPIQKHIFGMALATVAKHIVDKGWY